MQQSDQSTAAACSRRNFLQMSAGAMAGIALMSMPKLSFASSAKITPTTLANCPTDPLIVANGSELVQHSHQKILALAKTIKNTSLRAVVLEIIHNPAPTVMQLYPTNSSIAQVYQQLIKNGLVDSDKVKWNTLFPPYKHPQKAPQPFISAPGSGYSSHHAYPGGLSTHTAANLCIADAICSIYQEILGYQVDRDVVIASEALHDLAKPWVFQWNKDGSCLAELPIAGTGAHHVLSIAESIYRALPANVIVAQACAHNNPGTAKDEAEVVNWIKAAAIIANKNPISLGLLSTDGTTLPSPHKQEGYITNLADHDFVLSVPAAQKSVKVLQEIAKSEYNLSENDLNSITFNKFRNYIAAQVSMMRINHAQSDGNAMASVKSLVRTVITK